jgi:hypothetical protein
MNSLSKKKNPQTISRWPKLEAQSLPVARKSQLSSQNQHVNDDL